MMWLLILLIFPHCNVVHPFPVFTFTGTSSSLTATPSYAYLVNDFDLRDKFILCTSVKQARFDDIGFYVISGKDSGDWLTAQFSNFSNEIWLTIWWDGAFYRAGKLQNPMLDIWYYICLRFSLKTNEIEATVNGRLIGRLHGNDVINKPDKLAMKIGLGNDNQQFQGSMTNIRVLEEVATSNTLSMPCRLGQDNLLSWNPENWSLVGSQWSLIEEFEDQVCDPSNFYNLAISTKMTFEESMDICKQKLNQSIIPFDQDDDQFLRYVDWHVKTTEGACSYLWTPLTKSESDGLLLDMNDNTEKRFQNWARGQPNGGEIENFVVINIDQRALADTEPHWSCCSSCSISKTLLLQLNGRCEHSIIGNV